MLREVSVKDGISTAISMIERILERPVLVTVSGNPDSGKSHLIGELSEELERRGMSVLSDAHISPHIVRNPSGRAVHDVWLYHATYSSAAHINMRIYNPAFDSRPEGGFDFDILISNPGSVRKYGQPF